ncbi:MAG: hypothetical protein ACXWF8_01125 [Methylobacter sp.]
MTPKELTGQALKLYDNLKVQSYQATDYSDYSKRLHILGLRAFSRYKRRLEFEQRQEYLFVASRWGF